MQCKTNLPDSLYQALDAMPNADAATRQLSSSVIQEVAKHVPRLIGGSADLSCSDNTMMKSEGIVSAKNYNGRNIKYGVREFAMGAMASGLALNGSFLPYVGTFLMFRIICETQFV